MEPGDILLSDLDSHGILRLTLNDTRRRNALSEGMLTRLGAALSDAAANGAVRVTTPEDMADAVLCFASPWARAVTGQNLIVDGGLVFG